MRPPVPDYSSDEESNSEESESQSGSDTPFSLALPNGMSMDSLLGELVDMTLGFATKIGVVPQFQSDEEADMLRSTILSMAPSLAERVIHSTPEILNSMIDTVPDPE
jgi:hypothetical protein